MIYKEIVTKSGKILRQITPEMPYEWLTNKAEDTFSKLIYLGKDADTAEWRDATQEEYEKWEEKQREEESNGGDMNE